MAPTPRVLIVRIAAIGDAVLTTPLVARIRAEHPGAEVTWLCGSRIAELVRLFPGVDRVVEVNEGDLFTGGVFARARAILDVWRRLGMHRFDHVLMLHPDPRFRILLAPVRAESIHTAAHPPGRSTNPIPGRFRGDESARLLDDEPSRGPIVRQYELVDLRDRIEPDKSKRRESSRVVLVPGGARNVLREDALRRWPLDSYVALAQELLEYGAEVVLLGDKNDLSFAAAFQGLPVQNLIGRTTLTQTLQVLRSANVVVTHDTGPLHLARLVRAPTVALFGPTDPAQFVGSDPLVTVVWGGEDLACRPCYDGRTYAACANNICINRVPVESVLAAVRSRLEHHATMQT